PPLWEDVHPRFRELASKKPPLADTQKSAPEDKTQGTAPPDARQPIAEGHPNQPPLADTQKSAPEDKTQGTAPPDARQPIAEGHPDQPPSVDASTPSAVDQKTMLTIILALLQEHKSIDINDPSTAAQKIVDLANRAKISLKPSNVYRHLKIAQTLLPTTSPASLPEQQAPNLPNDKKD